ncbi:peptidase S8/S53 domain-containing protein [Fimicolochytrium jonesii]|uniref:peptidase S8/S53 domain-containing protein n=1 Tax=Fimicolochytrium jonesii TaxID=1396493 RepID=UPI0022FE5174|nr:peptidase S8/S53 domain-containing protein [Fimicolochytrium jonesii]KAI8817607.1 peptidase S8/S53 domain-containing protein [Fimicolochytrium jonesii]
MRLTLASLTTVLVVALQFADAKPHPKQNVAGTPIPEQYIVVFKKDVEQSTFQNHVSWLQTSFAPSPLLTVQALAGGVSIDIEKPVSAYGIKHAYDFSDFKGYAAKLPKDVAEALRQDPSVDYIEEDKIVSITGKQGNPGSWGLQRIHTRKLPLSSNYEYPDSAGEGVNAYIIDTGIFVDHPEFEGRAKIGKSFTTDGDADGNGHGTHVAGTIGSKTFGVAKKVSLIAVKVLDARGSGTTSDVIAGIEYVTKEAPKRGRKSVANMSLGGGASTALDRAVQGAIKAGVNFAIAAGNSGRDACLLSPARVPEAITVAASDKTDHIASFSERGTCVDIIAPGVDITSTWNNGRTNTISGTSMATPHVAGVVALALAEGNFTTPAEVQTYLKVIATKDLIQGTLQRTPNAFLYNNVKDGKIPDKEPAEPAPLPPSDPNEPAPGDGVCPFPQCLFDPACTECCIDCLWQWKGKSHRA